MDMKEATRAALAARDREETQETQKTAQEVLAEEERKLRELAETPISREEANKAFANCEVNRVQLTIVRQKWCAQKDAVLAQVNQIQQKINQVDEALYQLELEKALTFRRTLNAVPEETAAQEA